MLILCKNYDTSKNGVTSITYIQLLIVFKAKTLYKRHSNNHHNNFIDNFSYIPQLYNNKDLLKTIWCTITKTYRVQVHPIVESRHRQCKLRTRQHLAKLPLASQRRKLFFVHLSCLVTSLSIRIWWCSRLDSSDRTAGLEMRT